ncbi:MAG: ATP-dependent Clp protease adaptor ClpS [Bacteroidales bacterium]|nr:ATP-dependent Clp protease adaptor ClpS [Bacteroidales bacterium]
MTKKDTQIQNSGNPSENLSLDNILVLHNDDFNTFDFVIECLVTICDHDDLQAEQCAFLTHYKGKCEIKKGKFDILKPMKDSLVEKGLSVTLE